MCPDEIVYQLYIDAMEDTFEEFIPEMTYSNELTDNELLDFTGPVDIRQLETLIQEEYYEQFGNDPYDMPG